MPGPVIAIGPSAGGRAVPDWAVEAVAAGGGRPVDDADPEAEGLVWLDPAGAAALGDVLAAATGIRWVQLPFAGIETIAASGVITAERAWTCAKGSYAEPVAEHALTLALAGLRHLPERVVARSWGPSAGTSLYDRDVTILGGGGITAELLRLLAPYRVRATVVRRDPAPVPGAHRTVATAALHDHLEGAQVVFLALALTPATRGIIGAAELDLMGDDAWLVNVARGGHVDTAALVAALQRGAIAGAALDVTDPEPLPDGHPLWDEPRCLITPHTADTWDMVVPRLCARIRTNVARFGAGEPLEGLVDAAAGY